MALRGRVCAGLALALLLATGANAAVQGVFGHYMVWKRTIALATLQIYLISSLNR